MLELVGDFFGRKKKCVGAGISGGVHVGPTRQGARRRGAGAPCALVARWWVPLVCSKCQKFSNVLQKTILNFQGIWRTFIFGVFFVARIIQKTDRKY